MWICAAVAIVFVVLGVIGILYSCCHLEGTISQMLGE